MARFDDHLDLALTQVALRALRHGNFPADIFDEYAWDMLLHLYIAHLRGEAIDTAGLIEATSKNEAVGERWLRHLAGEAMIERDGARVALTAASLTGMIDYHDRAIVETAT